VSSLLAGFASLDDLVVSQLREVRR
jgi:hypothetical protein